MPKYNVVYNLTSPITKYQLPITNDNLQALLAIDYCMTCICLDDLP